MSMREIADALLRSFEASTAALDTMRAELQLRRTAWVSARPSTLAAPAQALQGATEQLAAEEAVRGRLFAEARDLLPTVPGATRDSLRVRVAQIAAALPFAQAARLRQAAAAAARAARSVRGEVALGNRLLTFAQRAQESLFQDQSQEHGSVGGYDRNARRTANALPAGLTAGVILDGRI